jgi:hypothetical protein
LGTTTRKSGHKKQNRPLGAAGAELMRDGFDQTLSAAPKGVKGLKKSKTKQKLHP